MGSTKSCFVRENIPSVHLKMPPSYIFIYIRVAALPDKRNSTHTSVRIENIKKYWVLMNLHLSLYLPAPGKSFFPNTSQMFLFVCLCTYFPKPGLSTLAPPPLWFLAPDDRLTKWDCSGDKWREKHLEFKLIWHFHPKGGRTYLSSCCWFLARDERLSHDWPTSAAANQIEKIVLLVLLILLVLLVLFILLILLMYTDYTAPTMAHTAHISHTAYTAYTAHTEANQTRVFWTDLQPYMTVQDLQISWLYWL